MTIFLADIKNKELNFGSPFNVARWHDFLKKNEGKTLRIELPERKRTLPQNRLLWAYMEIISRETGDDPVSLHEFFKAKLLPPRILTIRGKSGREQSIEVPASTTKLSKADFGEYLDRIAFVSGVPVPDPRQLENFMTNY